MNGSIRIIGGKFRGRKLVVLNHEGLRPTPDRVKETLFNWLMPVIHESVCLDCFSGSGSLGFESLSRGAKQVFLLEKNPSASIQLKKNIEQLHSTHCNLINTDTLNWLNKPADKQFDIVFIDPPFHQQLAQKTIQLLEKHHWLKSGSYIYIETEKNSLISNQIPENWICHREKNAGLVHSHLFIKER